MFQLFCTDGIIRVSVNPIMPLSIILLSLIHHQHVFRVISHINYNCEGIVGKTISFYCGVNHFVSGINFQIMHLYLLLFQMF